MRLIFIGPPGAGKGTQSTRLCNHYSICHLSTGDILRQAIEDGTELGRKVEPLMSQGKLVGDELIVSVIKDRIQQDDCADGFLLDGFPRTLPQATSFDTILEELPIGIDRVIEIRVPNEELMRRLLGRAKESNNPRPDDSEETISDRLGIFQSETRPLVEFYEEQSLLLTVDGVGTMDEVFDRIVTGME